MPDEPLPSWDSAPTRYPDPGTHPETPILASPAPQGDAIYVPVNIRHIDRATNVDSTVTTMVYRVDTATAAWTLVPLSLDGATQRVNREINSLEVSEDGKEIMVSMTRRADHSDYDGAAACHDETLEWISIDRSPNPRHAPGEVLRRVFVPQGASCGGWVEAGGTVAPNRATTGQPQMSAAPSSVTPSRADNWAERPLSRGAREAQRRRGRPR